MAAGFLWQNLPLDLLRHVVDTSSRLSPGLIDSPGIITELAVNRAGQQVSTPPTSNTISSGITVISSSSREIAGVPGNDNPRKRDEYDGIQQELLHDAVRTLRLVCCSLRDNASSFVVRLRLMNLDVLRPERPLSAVFPELYDLELSSNTFHDEDVPLISGCQKLTVLKLYAPRLTSTGIAHLGQLTSLKYLDVFLGTVQYPLAHLLRALPGLQHVTIRGCQFELLPLPTSLRPQTLLSSQSMKSPLPPHPRAIVGPLARPHPPPPPPPGPPPPPIQIIPYPRRLAYQEEIAVEPPHDQLAGLAAGQLLGPPPPPPGTPPSPPFNASGGASFTESRMSTGTAPSTQANQTTPAARRPSAPPPPPPGPPPPPYFKDFRQPQTTRPQIISLQPSSSRPQGGTPAARRTMTAVAAVPHSSGASGSSTQTSLVMLAHQDCLPYRNGIDSASFPGLSRDGSPSKQLQAAGAPSGQGANRSPISSSHSWIFPYSSHGFQPSPFGCWAWLSCLQKPLAQVVSSLIGTGVSRSLPQLQAPGPPQTPRQVGVSQEHGSAPPPRRNPTMAAPPHPKANGAMPANNITSALPPHPPRDPLSRPPQATSQQTSSQQQGGPAPPQKKPMEAAGPRLQSTQMVPAGSRQSALPQPLHGAPPPPPMVPARSSTREPPSTYSTNSCLGVPSISGNMPNSHSKESLTELEEVPLSGSESRSQLPPPSLEWCATIPSLQSLHIINVNGPWLEVSALVRLTELVIKDSGQPSEMQALSCLAKGLKNLQRLALYGTSALLDASDVTNSVSRFSELESLNIDTLGRTRNGFFRGRDLDNLFVNLPPMAPRLRSLVLRQPGLTLERLRVLAPLTGLTRLEVGDPVQQRGRTGGVVGFVSPIGLASETGAAMRFVASSFPKLRFLSLGPPSNETVTEGDLAALAVNLQGLTRLELQACNRPRNERLGHLLGLMTSLRSLDLSNCLNLLDSTLSYFTSLSNLTSLQLRGCWKVSGEGLGVLRPLLQLQKLDLSDCRISDEGMKEVARLTQLTNLQLFRCWSLGAPGVAAISELRQLAALNLASTNTDDAGVSLMVRSLGASLTDLNLAATLISHEGVKALAEALPRLRRLNLSKCSPSEDQGVDDQALKHLTTLVCLRCLHLKSCRNITDSAVRQLAAKLPRLLHFELNGCWGVAMKTIEELYGTPNAEWQRVECMAPPRELTSFANRCGEEDPVGETTTWRSP